MSLDNTAGFSNESPLLSEDNSGGLTKYSELLTLIGEMGRDVRGAYAGSKVSLDRLKKNLSHVKTLVHECLADSSQ